ncbi:hypothetical protein LAZ67_3000575 [Cordylochernes scorpioides]|uniref:GIY-YIG domain-containing protein n=1 Tax=Cordylochernes scorpioides TaxID=51811 RepID=A0ABY6K746_9ARAC|nr:hypothetical protein LAZ67_3000575 [Cordylochernes scorpioides]
MIIMVGRSRRLLLLLTKRPAVNEVQVEARVPGKVKVEAELQSLSASVELEVVPYLEVRPSESPLLLLPGSRISLSLVSFPKGRPQAVDPDQLSVEISGEAASGLLYDSKSSILQVPEDPALVGLSSSLTLRAGQLEYTKQVQLAAPASLKLAVSPAAPEWNLVESRYYTIQLQLYDSAGHSILVPDNLVAKVRFPSKHFNIIRSSANGTHHVVQTLVPGLATVRVEVAALLSQPLLTWSTDAAHPVSLDQESLQSTISWDGSTKIPLRPKLEVTQELHILQQLQVLPSVLLLPQVETQVGLKLAGGSGRYSWTSSSPQVASLTPGLSHISTGSRLGEATIVISDLANPSALSTSISVSIQEVVDIGFAPTLLETYVGSEVILPLMLYGYEDPQDKKRLKAFDNCTAIPLHVEVVDILKFRYIKNSQFPPLLKSCRSLELKCRRPGHTRVYVNHEQLRTTAVVACHKVLKTVQPLRAAVLARGTSMEVVYEGGPRAWPMYPAGHYLSLTSTNSTLTSHIVLQDPYRYNKDLHIFRVTCNDLGETYLELKVGNQPSATNPSPAKEEASTKLVCGVPASAHLRLRLDAQVLRNTTILLSEVKGKTLDVDIWLKDSLGRKFSNMSSLAVRWIVSDPSLARMANPNGCQSQANGAAGYRKLHRGIVKGPTPGIRRSCVCTHVRVGSKGICFHVRNGLKLQANSSIARALSKFGVRTLYSNSPNISSLIRNPDTKSNSPFNPSLLSGCVYSIPCADCDVVYVGETGRSVGTRLEEHRKNISRQDEKSAIYQHIRTTNHSFDLANPSVHYSRIHNKQQRLTLEALVSQGFHAINRHIDLPESYQSLFP